jgi:hypothetical protein
MKVRMAAVWLAGVALLVTGAGRVDAQAASGSVSVVHGLRGVVADVYLDGQVVLEGFQPERTTDALTIPAGDHQVEIRPAQAPADSEPAAAGTLSVPAGANLSAVAHLSPEGDPTLSVYTNDLGSIPPSEARVVMRHTAAAPAINVSLGDTPLAESLTNPQEDGRDVAPATYPVEVDSADDGETIVPPQDVSVPDGSALYLYLIGSSEENNLGLLAQEISGLDTAPAGVPTGTDGLAPSDGKGFPVGLLALPLAAAAGAAAFLARPALRTRRVRR